MWCEMDICTQNHSEHRTIIRHQVSRVLKYKRYGNIHDSFFYFCSWIRAHVVGCVGPQCGEQFMERRGDNWSLPDEGSDKSKAIDLVVMCAAFTTERVRLSRRFSAIIFAFYNRYSRKRRKKISKMAWFSRLVILTLVGLNPSLWNVLNYVELQTLIFISEFSRKKKAKRVSLGPFY